MLGIALPIIQGPMRLITLAEMAAAVSESGGFGQIAASGMTSDRLRSEVKKTRELTNRPFGINIPIYRPNARDALEIAVESGLRTVTTCAGDPSVLMDQARQAGLQVLHKVSTVAMARKAEAAGVDGIIATGFEAGGHVGRDWVTTFCLIPQLADALSIPVVAAGGVADGRGLLAAMALGAEGVEIGTALLTSRECRVPEFFKKLILDAQSNATVLLGKREMPMRVLCNRAAERIGGPDRDREDRELRRSADSRYIMEGGVDAETAIMPCGQVSGLIRESTDIAGLLSAMMTDAQRLSRRLPEVFGENR